MAADALKGMVQGALTLVAPVFPGEPMPFGPTPFGEVAVVAALGAGICALAGVALTHNRQGGAMLIRAAARFHGGELRDEVWAEIEPEVEDRGSADGSLEEAKPRYGNRAVKKRTGPELLFIVVHNGSVSVVAALAWLFGSRSLALFAFCMEVGYEFFDTYSLGSKRLEPETLIHHLVSPICILCSTQTEVDFRVLCHLCICIDLSGAILGYSKFLLRYAHISSTQVYARLVWIHGLLRVAGPFIDTGIIMYKEVQTHGGISRLGQALASSSGGFDSATIRSDMTQLYFWAMAVLDAFNLYFFFVIRQRAGMPRHMTDTLEWTGCH